MEKSKSVVVKSFGGYDKLQVEDFPLPSLKGLVEVKVEYAGLNFSDIFFRQGLSTNRKLPLILGLECVGTITALGTDDNTNLKIGQRVICFDHLGGMYRETVRVQPEHCYPLPEGIPWDSASALFVTYLTAYTAVVKMGALQPNESILIQSCAGGVGTAATQLAKTVGGVTVYGTASKGKEEFAKGNGVDVVYGYEDNLGSSGGFDVIVAHEAGKALDRWQKLLKPLGRLVIIGTSDMIQNEETLSLLAVFKSWWQTKNIRPQDLLLNNRGVSGVYLVSLIEKDPAKVRLYLDHIFELFKEGKIKPKIDSVWSLDQIVDATKVLAQRRNKGKVLLQINTEK